MRGILVPVPDCSILDNLFLGMLYLVVARV